MRKVEEIIERAKLLSARERRHLFERLSDFEHTQRNVRRAHGRGGRAPCARSLTAAGTVHSYFSDFSSGKYKHVAGATLDGHGE